MSVKQDFLNWMTFKVQNGKQTRFWEDKWLGNSALKEQYPNLFNLVHRKHVTVHTVLNGDPLNVSFRRHLTGNNLRDWIDLGHRVANIQLVDNKDVGIWQLHKSGQFSVRSMYSALLDVRVLPLNKLVWKQKIPLKVKIFIWLLHRGVILTKDNLAKRNWKGSKQCCFRTNVETIAHLFFGYHLARLLWRIIFITFGLTKPNNIVQLFRSWLQGFRWEKKKYYFHRLMCASLVNLVIQK